MATKSLLHRAELALVQRIARLPERALLLLSGKNQIVRDGLVLHPQIQFILAGREVLGGRPLKSEDPNVTRRANRAEAMRYTEAPNPAIRERDLTVPLATSQGRARHYAPSSDPGLPLLVYFHGGGFVTGDLETHDAPCRLLCEHGKMHVVSVEYRLAPEHPFPAATDDAVAAFEWVRTHAADFGADPARVGVGGDSAGGNLAAVVCQERKRQEAPQPSFQLLIYPVTDQVGRAPSRELFSEGFFLTAADIDWFQNLYFGERRELARDPRASPLLEQNLRGLAPAVVVTAGFDPLRDEGDAYARSLFASGVKTTHLRYPGFIHGFVNMGSVSPAAKDAVIEVARAASDLARS
jgi:acetyl esterase